jgi:hypothetical protein
MDKKLTCDDSEDLEKELIINAFKKIGGGSIKQYKLPGLDGIINELYQLYYDATKTGLFQALLEKFYNFEI